MPAFKQLAIPLSILLSCTVVVAQVQSPPKESKGSGSITGVITLDGNPKPGIEVEARPEFPPIRDGIAKTTTDEEGHFQFSALGTGRYRIIPLALINIVASESGHEPHAKVVTLGEGEVVERIDFAFITGGVITGRVTDADGRPVVSEPLILTRIEENQRKFYRSETDDRGIYRIYGLPTGQYTLSAGGFEEDPKTRGSRGYPRTFHPSVTNEAQAKLIKLNAGTELTDVDLKFGPPIHAYVIAGRFIDAETGKAVPNAIFSYGQLTEESRLGPGYRGSLRADDKGVFRFDGVLPGRYVVFAMSEDQSGYYCDPVTVVVSREDINELEIKLHRGASISGRAIIEGEVKPEIIAMLQQMGVMTFPSVPGLLHSGQPAECRFGADGSFRIRGLRAGKAYLHLLGMKGFSLLRVERRGVDQQGGIDLAPNEQVTDVRLVIAYGNEIVRGQIKIEGGQLSEGTQMWVSSRRIGLSSPSSGPSVQVDSRGQFTLEGMITGEYELELSVMSRANPNLQFPRVKQSVTVVKGMETVLTLILNLGAKPGDK